MQIDGRKLNVKIDETRHNRYNEVDQDILAGE